MSRANRKEKIEDACPYCADPDFFDKVLTPTPEDEMADYEPTIRRFGSHWPKVRKRPKPKPPKPSKRIGLMVTNLTFGPPIDPRKAVSLTTWGVVRGGYHIKTVTDKDMIPRYAGFTVRIIGWETKQEPPIPYGPFMSRKHRTLDDTFISWDAVRITHADSPITVDLHWRPEHGRIMTVRGFTGAQTKPAELAVIHRALEFYRQETRGGPRVEDETLLRAVREQGERPTQEGVAATLGVSARALRAQLSRRAMTWDDLKEWAMRNEKT